VRDLETGDVVILKESAINDSWDSGWWEILNNKAGVIYGFNSYNEKMAYVYFPEVIREWTAHPKDPYPKDPFKASCFPIMVYNLELSEPALKKNAPETNK
jgi:hypothetical protein